MKIRRGGRGKEWDNRNERADVEERKEMEGRRTRLFSLEHVNDIMTLV